jgi:hypothetical protein
MTATGSELYAAARARALGRRGDPQHTTRQPGPPAEPDPDRACTCSAGDPLPHLGRYHHLLSPVKRAPRTWCCSIGTAAGMCPCTAYTPRKDHHP